MDAIQYSIVVLAVDHNPTVLNPDFLMHANIVDAAWLWGLSQEPITTPALSTVSYDSRVSITVDPGKAQFTDSAIGDPLQSKITDITSRYINALPYVKYSSIGINFKFGHFVDEPNSYIQDKLLNPSATLSNLGQSFGAGIRLAYTEDNRLFIISADSGKAEAVSGKQGPAVILSGNFHRTYEPKEGGSNIQEALTNLESDWSIFQSAVNSLIGD